MEIIEFKNKISRKFLLPNKTMSQRIDLSWNNQEKKKRKEKNREKRKEEKKKNIKMIFKTPDSTKGQ